jgi:2-polyprenyl-3-methyl-5-hydroxy-6-metoxy-1,4-benzoquinol methylase
MSTGYWNDLARHTDLDEIWMSHPLVRARINERVSGRAEVWPTGWLNEQLDGRAPLGRTMSVGCGIGNLERDLASQGIVRECLGIDTAGHCIEEARTRARESGLGNRLSYEQADARAALSRSSGLDAVFFHGSLHHFTDHHELLRLVAGALAPGGIVYVDEYVGPSRNEWRIANLVVPNVIYRLLPSPLRRARVVRAPINREDPTEAVESSNILPALEATFRSVTRRDYGGNLLSLLYPNMHRPAPGSAAREDLNRAVTFLLDLEDVILRNRALLGTETWFSVVIATGSSET